ncbi:MAG: YgiT-type zinc finger protein [Chloroflexi bacterium]|nr:YgiT-type zinc finger protein [Chloroflexota bacterium]
MKCVVCHGDDIEAREVNEELKVGSDIVFVPMSLPVCRTCGERYYDRRTIRFLEEVEEKLKGGKLTLHQIGKVLACD